MLTFVFGTRPERQKIRSVCRNLTSLGVPWQAVCSDQHTTLLDGLDHDPDFPNVHRLGLFASGDPIEYRDRLAERLRGALSGPRGAVVIQGDTATASAGGLAGVYLGRTVAHIEAGLRTHDLTCPWPEEGFRVQIAKLATWHYAPTALNRWHLFAEGVNKDRILVTGNPGLDLLVPLLQSRPVPFVPVQRVLVTLHRRESHGEPLKAIVGGLVAACQRFPGFEFVWPVHPNPAIQAALPSPCPPNLLLLPPLPPETFTQMLSTAYAVLTDSGGVQEEAAFLGVPCVIARDKTDRPESVEAGVAVLVGTTTDGVRVGLTQALTGGLKAVPSTCFGDGMSGQRIAGHLKEIAT